MPETVLNVPTVYENHTGEIAPARILALDLTDGMAFAEIFSLALMAWVTTWKPISSFWLN